MDLVLTGRMMDAVEAERAGLVSRVVPAAQMLDEALTAATQGTNLAYNTVSRPTADLTLAQTEEASIGQLLQMLMLATVVEGRLVGTNPYGQPGVEAYKRNMNAILRRE